MFDSVHESTEKQMLKGIHKLLDEADVVVHQYGSKFDIPMLNTEFVKHGMLPPSPYKQVDLKTVSSKVFRFPSAKLEHVAKAMGIGQKMKEDVVFELWVGCMKGDEKAWQKMKEYNINDMVLLEGLYEKYLPWVPHHPNRGAYQTEKQVCPHCGGKHYHKRGFATAHLMTYQRFQCQDCGAWFRSSKTITNKGLEKYVGV